MSQENCFIMKGNEVFLFGLVQRTLVRTDSCKSNKLKTGVRN